MQGDVNDDKAVDFQIQVNGDVALGTDDFLGDGDGVVDVVAQRIMICCRNSWTV